MTSMQEESEIFYGHSLDSEEAAKTFFKKIYERNVSGLLCPAVHLVQTEETELMFN